MVRSTRSWSTNTFSHCARRRVTSRKVFAPDRISSMNITIRPEHEKLIAQAMETGGYQDPDEVIARALELLHSEHEWLHSQAGEIEEKIERAFAQFVRGECFSAEESRADRPERKRACVVDV